MQTGEIKRLIYTTARSILISACTAGGDADSIPRAVETQLGKVMSSRNTTRKEGENSYETISDILPVQVVSQLIVICHNAHIEMQILLKPLLQPGKELRLDAEKNTKGKPKKNFLPDAMWVWRSTSLKYLGMVIPVLQTIRDVFLSDARTRNQIGKEFPGKENSEIRRSKLRAIAAWQREVPDVFDLLPQKPRAVNFVEVSRTTAFEVFRNSLEDTAKDPFWWKRILQLDDDRDMIWKKVVNASDFLERKDLTRIIQTDSMLVTDRRFRRNRWGKGNSKAKRNRRSLPSRIPSLATSPLHLAALKRLGIPPTHRGRLQDQWIRAPFGGNASRGI